jgi:DNA-binding response OmpR family regulator
VIEVQDPTPDAARVLIVDDDEQVRKLIGTVLERAGYTPVEASTVGEADRLMNSEAPDSVVLDLVMADGSGCDLLREWRARRVEAPVLVLTGYADRDNMTAALEAGADLVATKPFLPHELTAHMATLLQRTRSTAN